MFPFDYLKKEFVMVLVDNKILTYSKNYTVEGKKVLLKNAPSTGAFVCIKRCTDTTPLVAWNDSNILNASELNLFKTQLFHIAEELSETTTDGQGNPIIPDGTSNETLKLIDQLKEQIETVATQFDDRIGQTLNEVEKASEKARTVSKQLIKEHDNDANAHELAFRKHGIKDGSASVTGGDVTHTSYFQERKSGIFFASAGFKDDFDEYDCYGGYGDDWTEPDIYATYGYNCYVGKRVNMSEFYASVYHERHALGETLFTLKISDSQYLRIVLKKSDDTRKTLELYQSTTFSGTGTVIGTATNTNTWGSKASGNTELYIDLISKQLKVYQLEKGFTNWHEWSFDISNLSFTNNVVRGFYWHCSSSGNSLLKNFALSTSRIYLIHFRGLYATALGDYTDFDKEGSDDIIDTGHTSTYGVTASKKDSRQTYYMVQPTSDQIDPKASILGLYTTVETKGDSVTALTDIMRFNGVDYEGLSAVPSPNALCRFSRIFETNPNTGTQWQISDLGKIQLGCRILGQPIE